MACLMKRGDRDGYYVKFKRGGKWVRKAIGTNNKAEALRILRDIQALENSGAEKETTVLDLTSAYLEHAKNYYGPRASHTSSVNVILRTMPEVYSGPVDKFTPLHLEQLRQKWVDRGLIRRTCNTYTRIAKQMFKWGVSQTLLAPNTYLALSTLADLREGKTAAPDNEDVPPAPEEHVEAALKHLSPVYARIVKMQLLTAARPGEILDAHWEDIERRDGAGWVYRPSRHKNKWRGKKRTIMFGPQCKEILFKIGLRSSGPVFGVKYNAYRSAIHAACDKAGVPRWNPNQLRHTAATRIRAQHDIETAQLVLGHANPNMTEIYAERDMRRLEIYAQSES